MDNNTEQGRHMRIRKVSIPLLLSATLCSPLSSFADILSTPTAVCDRYANMYGPLQFTIEYVESLGYVFDPKYINSIGSYDALSFEFGFGGSEFRGAFSWGHALTPDMFFKFSAEYFAQDPKFHFESGSDTEWIGQAGFGADLRIRQHAFTGFHGYHAGLQYTIAENIQLDSIVIPMGGGTNKRKIAGGRDYGATLGVILSPWHASTFDVDIHYDSVEWRKSYSKDKRLSGFGLSVVYNQLIGGHWKIFARGTDRQPYYEYKGGLRYLTDVGPGTRLELGGHYSLSGGEVPKQRESRYGLSIFYTWGGNRYTSARPDYRGDVNYGTTRELIDYTNEPAVRPPQVLAITDETVIP